MSEVLLSVRGLKKTFSSGARKVEVLKGVDLTVHRGESICILGVSGTGKSTLLHLLGTLDVPTEGHIFYDDRDVFTFSPEELAAFRNRTIGFVFQFHYLLPEFTALENVMMPAMIAREVLPETRQRARELLEKVGVGPQRFHHKPGELSGGEQQRVAIARALMMSPSLLLADEPTGNLDPKTARTVHELILSLNEEVGLTVIVVSHNRELAGYMNAAYTLKNGRLEETTVLV